MDASMPSGGAAGTRPSSFVETAKETAGHLATEAKEQVTSRATSQLDSKKEKAADGLSSVANALRSTQGDLEEVPLVGDYAKRAADSVDQLSNYIQTRTLGQLVGDVEGFAKREPALFFGGAFALGMLAGRFLKSSPPKQDYTGNEGADMSRSFQGTSTPSLSSYGTTTPRKPAYAPPSPTYSTSSSTYGTSSTYASPPPTPRTPSPAPTNPIGDSFAVPTRTPSATETKTTSIYGTSTLDTGKEKKP